MKDKGGIHDYELFKAAQDIARCVLSYAKAVSIMPDDHRMGLVNPWYFSTEKGLFLQCYRGMPVALWTPWGEFCFCGDFYVYGSSVERKKFLQKVLEIFKVKLYMEEKDTLEEGSFGPVYGIHRVNGRELPVPTFPRAHRISKEKVEEALTLWSQFKDRYHQKASR